jgi:transposase InsO family protein
MYSSDVKKSEVNAYLAGMGNSPKIGKKYCCNDNVNKLSGNNIKISMTEHGDPLENAIAERVNGILKTELLNAKCPCFETASQEVIKAVWVYNSLRPHFSCDMLTPVQAHHKEERLKNIGRITTK